MHPDAAAWLSSRTSNSDQWPIDLVRRGKGETQVSVVLPALDEEATVGGIVTELRRLADGTGLVDEIMVIDSGSVDRTAEVARAAGAEVLHRDDILPAYGSRPGKGDVLWKALHVTRGDVIVYVDADLTSFAGHYLTGLLGPLLTDPSVLMVKAFYDRPLLDVSATGGGRVTELMARPLLNASRPELAGVIQPLAGEYAARRGLLESLPFAAGYGVETGLLLDTVSTRGLNAVAQVDLGHRVHGHQDTAALGRMAATTLHTVLDRTSLVRGAPERAQGLALGSGSARWPTLTQYHRSGDGRALPDSVAVTGPDRPPMVTIPEYRRRHDRASGPLT